MTTTLIAHFDGKVIVPDEPVELPTGCRLEIRVETADVQKQRPGSLLRLAERAAKIPANPDAPTDGAAQHDHYLHGQPKRP
jgi:hypothetical protein